MVYESCSLGSGLLHDSRTYMLLMVGRSIMLYVWVLVLVFRLPRAPVIVVRLPSIVAVLPSFPTRAGLELLVCRVPRWVPSLPILRVSTASRALAVPRRSVRSPLSFGRPVRVTSRLYTSLARSGIRTLVPCSS